MDTKVKFERNHMVCISQCTPSQAIYPTEAPVSATIQDFSGEKKKKQTLIGISGLKKTTWKIITKLMFCLIRFRIAREICTLHYFKGTNENIYRALLSGTGLAIVHALSPLIL